MSSPADGPDGPIVAAAGGAVWRRADDGAPGGRASSTGPATTTGRCPRASSTPASTRSPPPSARSARRPGLAVVVGRRSVRTRYPVPEGAQAGRLLGDAGRSAASFEPNHEVDELRWLPVDAAAELCSHEHDRAVLADLARTDVPLMPTLLLVRHGRAGDRSELGRPRRPAAAGRARAARRRSGWPRCCRLFGPTEVLSAPPHALPSRPSTPLAERLGLPVSACAELGEEEFADDPEAGLAAGRAAARARGPSPGVTVVCSQGGAIPSVLMALGVQRRGPARLPAVGEGQRLGAGRPARGAARRTTTATSTPTRTPRLTGSDDRQGLRQPRRPAAPRTPRCRAGSAR